MSTDKRIHVFAFSGKKSDWERLSENFSYEGKKDTKHIWQKNRSVVGLHETPI